MYQKDERTKGRIMLVDDDLVDYFAEMSVSSLPMNMMSAMVPARLKTEYADFCDGYRPGPLMLQCRQFEQLLAKNKIAKHNVTSEMLCAIQAKFQPLRANRMCYCYAPVPAAGLAGDFVVCSHRGCDTVFFHKSCIQKLGAEKATRWYCTACEEKMSVLARKTLRQMGYTDVPCEDDMDEKFGERLVDMLNRTGSLTGKEAKRMKHIGGMVGFAAAMGLR